MVYVFCGLLIPLIQILAGRMMWKHCPKEINDIVGYRTKRSKQNKDTWQFAHEYCGKLWWRTGWILLGPSAAVMLLLLRGSEDATGTAGHCCTRCSAWYW